MKQYIALTLLVAAFAVAIFSLFGDDSYSRMRNLRTSIDNQQEKNSELESRVNKLQTEISELRFNNKKLEVIARDELGMARPNEMIFRFDSSLDEDIKKIEEERSRARLNIKQDDSSASVVRPSGQETIDSSRSEKIISKSVIKNNN